jgi:hypothetical protein
MRLRVRMPIGHPLPATPPTPPSGVPCAGVQSWHHTSVLYLFWAFENARMTNHWFLVLANSFVHVFVYGYFALSTMGYTVVWKKYITLLQVRGCARPGLVPCAASPPHVLTHGCACECERGAGASLHTGRAVHRKGVHVGGQCVWGGGWGGVAAGASPGCVSPVSHAHARVRCSAAIQILQFVADIVFAMAYPPMKSMGWTHGDDGPFILGNFIGLTFIVLFAQVYRGIAREPPAGVSG